MRWTRKPFQWFLPSIAVILVIRNSDCSLHEKKCDCGSPNNISSARNTHERIVGGIKVIPHKYPWLAILQLNGTFLCGGSIISDQFILTAAHCLKSRYQQSLLKVIVGDHNRCKPDSKTTILSVTKVLRHYKFNFKDFSGDIMLLKLSMKLTFNNNVRPICLPTFDIGNDIIRRHGGKRAKVVGWGKLSQDQTSPSCTPHELLLPILDKSFCGIENIPDSLFCAGFIEGGQDSCQGDSGGPLQILNQEKHRYEIIGVVSNGIGCALKGHPGLYTDVMRYLPWIWKHTENTLNCW